MKLEWSNLHSLKASSINNNVPKQSGVYSLWINLKKSVEWRCFYIGKADNLAKKLTGHNNAYEQYKFNYNKVITSKCGFKYAITKDETKIEDLKQFLLKSFNLDSNEIATGAESIEVNLSV